MRLKGFAVVATMCLLISVVAAGAQRPGQAQPGTGTPRAPGMQQHTQQQQQQLARLQEMTHRMERLHDRALRLSQQLAQDQRHTHMREQRQLLHQFSESVGTHVQEMQRSADRVRQMIHDPAFAQDRDMQRDCDRLREHLHRMTTDLEDMVQIMERMQKRLGPPPS
jgi:uncharacterized protein YukE